MRHGRWFYGHWSAVLPAAANRRLRQDGSSEGEHYLDLPRPLHEPLSRHHSMPESMSMVVSATEGGTMGELSESSLWVFADATPIVVGGFWIMV